MGAAEELNRDKSYSLAEYFAFEEETEEKHEYHNGEILAMSGGSVRHSLLGMRMGVILSGLLRKKGCHIFNSDVKIELAEFNHYVYPDVAVVCGELTEIQGRNDIINNPMIIVEILSDSTEAYDRGKKFQKYRSLKSLKEYILVSQFEESVEVYSRQDDNVWRMSAYGPEKKAQLLQLDLSFEVNELYQGII